MNIWVSLPWGLGCYRESSARDLVGKGLGQAVQSERSPLAPRGFGEEMILGISLKLKSSPQETEYLAVLFLQRAGWAPAVWPLPSSASPNRGHMSGWIPVCREGLQNKRKSLISSSPRGSFMNESQVFTWPQLWAGFSAKLLIYILPREAFPGLTEVDVKKEVKGPVSQHRAHRETTWSLGSLTWPRAL